MHNIIMPSASSRGITVCLRRVGPEVKQILDLLQPDLISASLQVGRERNHKAQCDTHVEITPSYRESHAEPACRGVMISRAGRLW